MELLYAAYWLAIAMLMAFVNIKTGRNGFVKWLTYVAMWAAIITSVVLVGRAMS